MYQAHPYANIFPMMSDEEMANLVKSMQEYGYDPMLPIVLYDGKILDGRNRYAAAQKAGVEPTFMRYEGDDVLAYAIRLNLQRRHLDSTQRAVVASRLANMTKSDGAKITHSALGRGDACANLRMHVSQPEAAEMLNVSRRLVQTVKAVEQQAPELLRLMEAGKMTAHEAMKELKKKHKQEKIEEIKSKASEFTSDSIQIFNIDFREHKWKQGEVDLILTDPPYPAEFLPLWGDLFKIAKHALKPHGFLVTYSGQMYLDQIFRMAYEAGIDYYWMMNIEFTKKPLVHGRKVLNEWKPILVFQNGLKQHDRVFSDKIQMDYSEREMHDLNWGQTIEPFKFLLDKFSNVNDLVFEPFAGSGTTLIACQEMNRRCVGTELESKYIDLIKGRLNERHLAQQSDQPKT